MTLTTNSTRPFERYLATEEFGSDWDMDKIRTDFPDVYHVIVRLRNRDHIKAAEIAEIREHLANHSMLRKVVANEFSKARTAAKSEMLFLGWATTALVDCPRYYDWLEVHADANSLQILSNGLYHDKIPEHLNWILPAEVYEELKDFAGANRTAYQLYVLTCMVLKIDPGNSTDLWAWFVERTHRRKED